MRRGFGRGRRGRSGSGDARRGAIDAAQAFEKIAAAGISGIPALDSLVREDVPTSFAVVGAGTREDGSEVIVAYAPRHGGDAALAALACAAGRTTADGRAAEVVAIAPQWSIAARRRLALLSGGALRVRAIAEPSLSDDGREVAVDATETLSAVAPGRAGAGLAGQAEQELFQRALSAFEGLAAKHGGALRAADGVVELVVLAGCVAVLRARNGAVELETRVGDRQTSRLSAGELATQLDGLEGLLRKRLGDRRVRGGEPGLRSQVAAELTEGAGLRGVSLWPLVGSEPPALDLVGVREDGRPLVAAVRERLSIEDLAAILDAFQVLSQGLSTLLADVSAPVTVGRPQLALAATAFDESVLGIVPGHAKLASGRWSGASGRAFHPQGSDERFQRLITSHSPFPSLLGTKASALKRRS